MRYADETFLSFTSKLHVTKCSNYMNSQYRNVYFIAECKGNHQFSILDINIYFFDTVMLHIPVSRKPTFGGVLTNFETFYQCFSNIILFPLYLIAVL